MDKDYNEPLQRLRRIETRLTRLCQHVGLDPTNSKVRVTLTNAEPPILELGGLDVSIADVLTYCRKEHILQIVTLMYKGGVVGSVVPVPTEAEVTA